MLYKMQSSLIQIISFIKAFIWHLHAIILSFIVSFNIQLQLQCILSPQCTLTIEFKSGRHSSHNASLFCIKFAFKREENLLKFQAGAHNSLITKKQSNIGVVHKWRQNLRVCEGRFHSRQKINALTGPSNLRLILVTLPLVKTIAGVYLRYSSPAVLRLHVGHHKLMIPFICTEFSNSMVVVFFFFLTVILRFIASHVLM